MSSLVVLLPAQPAGTSAEFAYVLTPDGRTVGDHASAPAALLPRPGGAGAEVVAVVPVQALSWHLVELPKGLGAGSPRLRSVLEGLLEDRLLDEPETLHFAVQPQARAGAPVWVAACDRAWLRSAVQALEAAGRPASRIVPEFAPEGDMALHALGEPQQALLVAAGEEGVTTFPLDAHCLPHLPQLPPEGARIAEPAVAALAEQVLQCKLQLQQAPQRWLQAAQSGWDLAQFDFASSSRARAWRKAAAGWADVLRAPQWRPARWAAVLLVGANLVGLNAWAWKERASLDAKREAIRQALTATFPQVKLVVDAPVQMERELAALRQVTGATGGRDLEAMLGALTTALPPERPVGNLEFAGGELRIKGVAYTPDEARAVSANLRSQGYGAAFQGDTLVITQEAAP
ncbi:MAG: general secretion pathway protein GspL [Burkholderiales bacterium]|nr:general secretion pathway protein GspL [Burkholderiales bacterium]